jgi:hypothetical protein
MADKCGVCGFYILKETHVIACGCTIKGVVKNLSEFQIINNELPQLSIMATSLGRLSWKLCQFQQIAENEKGSWLSAEEKLQADSLRTKTYHKENQNVG